MKEKNSIIEIIPIEQTGHICKPTTIATIDLYYATQHDFPPIPLNKKNNPLHQGVIKNPLSMRQLAKEVGSKQGELLEIKQVQDLATKIGYQHTLHSFDNLKHFKVLITSSIDEGNLIFAAFSVSLNKDDLGQPTTTATDEDKNEHAAVIHGYDEDRIIFSHWGQQRSSSFEEFYNSSRTLVDKRKSEQYINVKGKNAKGYKYDLIKNNDAEIKSEFKTSITPEENSGFKAKLLIIKNPKEYLEQFKKHRIELLEGYRLKLKQEETKLFNQNKTLIPQDKTNELDIRHLAHVFLDGEIGGTPLSGGSFLSSIHKLGAFLHFIFSPTKERTPLNRLIINLASSPAIGDENFFKKIQHHLANLYEFETEKQTIVTKYKKSENDNWVDIDVDLHKTAKKIISQFKEQKDLFIGGGFSGHPGHSAVYRLSQQKNEVYFCIYDPSNASFHETTALPSGTIGYYPIYAFTIPYLPENEFFLNDLLVALFRLELLPIINNNLFAYTERDLYQILHFAPSIAKGRVLPCDKLSNPRLPQQSGTCTWRAMELFIDALIPEPIASLQFMLAYQLHCFHSLEINQEHSEKIRPQSSQTIQLLEYSLVKLAKNVHSIEKLNEEEVKLIVENIKKWKNNLKNIPAITSQHIVLPKHLPTPLVTNPFFTKDLTIRSEAHLPKKGLEIFSSLSFMECIKTLVASSQVRDSAYIQRVEDFCFRFCNLSSPLIEPKSLRAEEQTTLLQNLNQIITQYHGLNKTLMPQSVVVTLSFMSLIDRLGKEKAFYFNDEGLSGPPPYFQQMSLFLNRLPRNPFLTTLNPKLDFLLNQLPFFYQNTQQQSLLDYYYRICDQASDEEKKILEQAWELLVRKKESPELITAVYKLFYGKNASYYCFLSQEERKKLNNSTPKLGKAFAIQAHIEAILVSCLEKVANLAYNSSNVLLWGVSPHLKINISKKYENEIVSQERIVRLEVESILVTDEMKESSRELFLKRSLLNTISLKDTIYYNALLSHFDGNSPNSQQIPYEQVVLQYEHPLGAGKSNQHPLIKSISTQQSIKNLLYHLRVSESCQVTAVLSALSNHLEWFESDDSKNYIWLSIFEPGRLLSTLINNHSIWLLLDALFKKTEGKTSKGEWFVLKIALHFIRYYKEAIKSGLLEDNTSIATLAQQWGDRFFNTAKASQPQDELTGLREALYLKLLCYCMKDEINMDWWETYWALALGPSLLAFQEESIIQRVLDEVTPLLFSANKQQLTSIVMSLLSKWGMDVKKGTVCVDLPHRRIVIDNNEVCFLPLMIRSSCEFSELFGNKNILAQKKSVSINSQKFDEYYFEYNERPYRIFFNREHLIIQAQGVGTNEESWYSYSLPSEDLKSSFNFSCIAFKSCPPLINQTNYRIWIANQNDWLVVDTTTKAIQYQRDSFNKTIDEINDVFSRFESPSFIHAYKKNKELYCSLERYGLKFQKISEDYQTADGRYTLVKEKNDWFGSGLELKDNKSGNHVLMVPVQRYIVCKDKHQKPIISEDKTSYVWAHDLSDELKKAPKFTFGWDYSKSERYIFFEINENKIRAKSSESQLYLAYLYLAQKKPKKALEEIKTCAVHGSFEEMKQLWWIVTSLPAEEEYQLRNSRTLAVQLRALYAMLKITNDVPLWAKSHTNPSSDPLSNTARYYEEEKNKLVYFVSNLAQHIKQYYIKYDTARPYLPSNMLLLVSEEELLLSYCIAEERRQYKGTNFIYSGVVALRYLEHFLEQEGKVYWSEQRHYLVKDSFAIEPFSWVAWFNTLNTKERDHFDSVFSKELNETALNKLNPYMPYPCLLEQCGSYFQLALSPTDEKTSSKIVEFCNNVIPLYAKKDDSNRQRDCAFLLVAEIMWALLHSKLTADFFAQEKGIDFVKNTAKWSRENNTTIPKIKCFILNTGHNTIQYKIKKKTVSVKESFKPEEFISNPSFIPEPMTKVYNSLIEIENTYKNKENELIEAIGKLENSFTNKEEQLKKLSDHFLKIEADKQTAINHFFEEEVDHVFFKVLLDPSISKKTVVSINNIKNTIKLCIESRAVNLTELTQTKAIPNLEDLLRYEYQSLDFISMGIEENLACQLPQEIIKLRHLLVFQERLTRIQHAGTEYAQKKNPQKAMALASALLHLNMPEKKQQVLFEYMNQLVLRPEQKRFMALFSKKDEQQRSKVLQLVMGGGKTKVILPLWAFETANSDSLAVILVPELALQVNFNDLSSTSLHSFNQKAHCLRFDRSTPSDPASLQALYEKLQIIRTEKDYIVSTASSVQSLELKYLEILKQQVDGKQDSAGEFKLYWLNKILTLIQKKGVVAIDEAHKVLHIKKELNYAIDKVSPIDTEVAQLMIELYMWLGEHAPEIKNYAVDPSEVMKDEKISQFMNKCLKLLLEKPPYWLLRASENNVMELEKYIKGSTISTDEQKKLDANPQKKRLWTVLREQFQVLLPATLRRKLYEHYGPSPESGIRYAIPYRANNAPTSFVFGNILETINYTIQMMMYQGVTTKQFQFLLSEWKKEALEDNREESLVQKKFEIIFGVGYRSLLAALDCNKVEVLEQFKKQFAHHPILLREVITPVIHQLSSEKKVLSSNPINLINQFYQVLAVTGTPQNHRTYASNIKMIYESRLGGDATVIGYITNKSTLKDCDSASQMQFIIKLLEEQGTEKQIQAIIDFGGFFIGKSNKDMAPLFMETYEKRPNYVLYYEEDSLYAYGKNTPCKSLHSTNPAYLTEELHCSPLERVTYYDQEHTLGSDIAQDEKACAIVTVDVLTAKLSEFLQAVMRMRGLGNNQSLIIVSNKKMLNIAQLIECLRKNEEKQLQEDIFHAGIKKIDDAFRNHLLMKLKNELDFNKRNEIFNITQSLFIHEEVDRTFLEAASISEVFQTYYKGNKKKWADVIDETLFPEELIQAIIHQTSQDCETLKLNHSLFLGQEIQQYREQQVEVHKEKELLLETVAQRINLISIQTDWVTSYLKERSPTLPEKWQLSKIIHSQYPDIKFAINTNLYASKNFLFTYETQQEFYSAYTKPGVSILFIWKENVLHGVLLCGEEAESAHKIITTKSLTHCFLMTLEGYAYGPTPFPEHSLQIKELLEQAQLLTGHIQSLLSNELSDWVAKDLQEKIAFLEKNGTFLNSNKQQIIRLLNRYVQLEPYVDEWHLSNAETNNFLDYLANKKTPEAIITRLKPILSVLENIRRSGASGQKDDDSITLLDDKLLVWSYKASIEWRMLFTKPHEAVLLIKNAMELFKQEVEGISLRKLIQKKYMMKENEFKSGALDLFEFFNKAPVALLLKNAIEPWQLAALFCFKESVSDWLKLAEEQKFSFDDTMVLLFKEEALRAWTSDDWELINFLLKEKNLGFEALAAVIEEWATIQPLLALYKKDGANRPIAAIKPILLNWKTTKPWIKLAEEQKFSFDDTMVLLFKEEALRAWTSDDWELINFLLKEKNLGFEALAAVIEEWATIQPLLALYKKDGANRPIAAIKPILLNWKTTKPWIKLAEEQKFSFDDTMVLLFKEDRLRLEDTGIDSIQNFLRYKNVSEPLSIESLELYYSCSSGNVEKVKYLCSLESNNKPDSKAVCEALIGAALDGKLEIVQCLCSLESNNKPDSEAVREALIGAALDGKLEIVQYLCSLESNNKPDSKAISKALKRTHLNWDIIQFLSGLKSDNKPNSDAMSDTLRKAALYDKLEIVQYLCSLESNNKPDSEAVREALIGAASRGKLKIVQYLCSLESNNKPDSKAISEALKRTHLNWDIIQFLSGLKSDNKPNSEAVREALIGAALDGKLEIVQCLCSLESNNKPDSEAVREALIGAAVYDKLEIVQYLCSLESNNKPDSKAISEALKRTHLNWDIIQFLSGLKSDNKPNSDAMSDTLRKAAVYDKLEIVQYLCSLESNNKPDSEAVREALIGAASRGKLKIVQYLCSLESNNKPDSKAISEALIGAALDGKLEIVQYLCSLESNNKPDSKAISEALKRTHLNWDIIQFLSGLKSDNKPNSEAVREALIGAALDGKLEIVQCLCSLESNNKPDSEAVREALIGAAVYDKLEIVQYLCSLESNNKPDSKAISEALKRTHLNWDIIQFLSGLKSDNKPNSDAMSDTLRKAAVYDKLEIVQYLCSLESNNKPDSEAVREALIGAASRGKLKIVQYLCSLESNNKPDSKAISEALIGAALDGKLEIVKFFCERIPGSKLEKGTVAAALLDALKRQNNSEIVTSLCEYISKNQPAPEIIKTFIERADFLGMDEVKNYFENKAIPEITQQRIISVGFFNQSNKNTTLNENNEKIEFPSEASQFQI